MPSSGYPKYINSESYQILSAGRDRIYGVGGQYIQNGAGDRLPITSDEISPPTAVPATTTSATESGTT